MAEASKRHPDLKVRFRQTDHKRLRNISERYNIPMSTLVSMVIIDLLDTLDKGATLSPKFGTAVVYPDDVQDQSSSSTSSGSSANG